MIEKMNKSQQPFSRWNFLMIGICCIMIIIGFLLMIGGGSSVEEGFNPDIFSTRRIVVGPFIAFLGFLFMAFAIFINPSEFVKRLRKKKTAAVQEENPEAKEGAQEGK